MFKQFLFVLFSILLAATAQAQSKALNLYIWSEYIDPEIIKDFEKDFSCRVTVDLYEDNESMLAKLEGGGDSLYDVVVPSDFIIPVMVKRGLLAPLRQENIPNMKNLDEKFSQRPFDPANKYTAPYQWGTVGLYIRKQGNQPIDETWGLLFDPSKQPGPFVMIDSMRECFSAALKYKGYKLNSVDPMQLKEVQELLLEAKKRALGFEGGVGGKNKVLAKNARMAMVYNGDAARGMNDDPQTYYFVPREGGEIWIDSMAIPSKAPHRDLAEKFINYILDPKVGAKLSNFNKYATPNKAAMAFIDPKDLSNTAIYPSPEIMSKLEFLEDLGKNTRLYDEIWTKVKSK